MKALTYADAPHDWALCFQNDCPLHTKCLRFRVGTMMPASVLHHETVLPAARQGDTCQCYAVDEPVVIARGMIGLFDSLPPSVRERVRTYVSCCFSSRSTYYRYRDGDYDITPEKQEEIAKIFEQFQPGSVPRYDKTTTKYNFPQL